MPQRKDSKHPIIMEGQSKPNWQEDHFMPLIRYHHCKRHRRTCDLADTVNKGRPFTTKGMVLSVFDIVQENLAYLSKPLEEAGDFKTELKSFEKRLFDASRDKDWKEWEALRGELPVCWESPFVESEYEISWDWSGNEPGLRMAAADAISELTSGVRKLSEGNGNRHSFPGDIEQRLERVPPDLRDEGKRLLALLPFLFAPGEGGILPNDLSQALESLAGCLAFEGRTEKESYSGFLGAAFFPLVVDSERERAFFPVVTGFLFDPIGFEYDSPVFPNPASWKDGERWNLLGGVKRQLIRAKRLLAGMPIGSGSGNNRSVGPNDGGKRYSTLDT